MNLDLLAIAAHPDDVELTCGGTLLRMAQRGYKLASWTSPPVKWAHAEHGKPAPRKPRKPAKSCEYPGEAFSEFPIPMYRPAAPTNFCSPKKFANCVRNR
jgi:hypothetical protein